MSYSESQEGVDRFLHVGAFRAAFESWLTAHPACLTEISSPIPDYAKRVEAMCTLMAVLHDEGWARYGWPEAAGGVGGSILHRGAMWEVLARHGVPGLALFEHLEILAPTLVAYGPPAFVARAMPEFLSGRELWAQGFSEPDAGSDLADMRTTATADGDVYRINGTKIWTSWARYATWCLVLARTGKPGSRHRGLSAFIVDLRSPGVEVHPIEQANGTDELAQVFFDDVQVSADRMVGGLGDGWKVAMHILGHERSTFAWFRHCFLYQHLLDRVQTGGTHSDTALGNALLDLASTTAISYASLEADSADIPLGPKAAFTKLNLCAAEQSVNDWVLANDPDIAIGIQTNDVAVRRQDYLFSRIVTVYGGAQQMQLETIAKRILGLP